MIFGRKNFKPTNSLIVRAAKMEDKDVLVLASKCDTMYGTTKQGDKLRELVKARKRHFSPAEF